MAYISVDDRQIICLIASLRRTTTVCFYYLWFYILSSSHVFSYVGAFCHLLNKRIDLLYCTTDTHNATVRKRCYVVPVALYNHSNFPRDALTGRSVINHRHRE